MGRRRRRRGYRWFGAICVAIPVVLLPWLAFKFSYWYVVDNRSGLAFNDREFGDAANWLQVLVALWTFAATAVGAWTIFDLKKQTQIQQEQAKAAAYRTLISPQMQSIKRFLYSEKVSTKLRSLKDELKEDLDEEDLKNLLELFRGHIDDEGRAMELPLLGRKACMDDIESVVNEYNYLCMLLLKGTIGDDFATAMSRENFRRIYEHLAPFLKLRRGLSRKYASHFVDYMELPGRPE